MMQDMIELQWGSSLSSWGGDKTKRTEARTKDKKRAVGQQVVSLSREWEVYLFGLP